MNAAEVSLAFSKHQEEMIQQLSCFRHAVSSMRDVFSYIEQDIKHEYFFHPASDFLTLNIYTSDYQLILDTIQKYRPRIIVSTIEIRDGFCTFNITHDNNWGREPIINITKIIPNLPHDGGLKAVK